MTSFADITKQVHLINDLILTDMTYGNEEYAEEAIGFSKHLLATKYWFASVSWANKRRYVLALLEDVRSAWAMSLLLKSIWNCRPKDAVMSFSECRVWSAYDHVPMDHNRTAQPVKTLAQVMTNDRKWFHTLEPEYQALVLSELVTVAGGPVLWEVMRRARAIFERYRSQQLDDLLECAVVNDAQEKQADTAPAKAKEIPTKTSATRGASPVITSSKLAATLQPQKDAQKELEVALATWNSTIKSIRDNQKLEELEMTFNDGTKRKIWKVNRTKPEAIETVDFVQLLPSSIGKRIISYLPRAQLTDYGRVNKYWAYLIDEFRAELTARQKINTDLEKLQVLMLKYDASMEVLQTDFVTAPSSQRASLAPSARVKNLPSMKQSEKSAGAVSFKHFLDEKLKSARRTRQKPIRNVAELSERLERRGAADENLWLWCANVLKQTNKKHLKELKTEEGVLRFGEMHFPCPLMRENLKVPLARPLRKDPSASASAPKKTKRNIISNANMASQETTDPDKRFSLWSRNFSSLYKVFKVASYQAPL